MLLEVLPFSELIWIPRLIMHFAMKILFLSNLDKTWSRSRIEGKYWFFWVVSSLFEIFFAILSETTIFILEVSDFSLKVVLENDIILDQLLLFTKIFKARLFVVNLPYLWLYFFLFSNIRFCQIYEILDSLHLWNFWSHKKVC